MPSPEKQVSTHTFNGGIDTSTAMEYLTSDKAVYILNCNSLSLAHGNVGVITNVKGNRLISTPLPAGENKTIGYANDEEANKFYFFVWNSNKLHRILQFDALNKTVTKLLENITDTGGIDIMNLDKDRLILHADVVRNNLLYWVDGLNNARKTNINKLVDKSATGYGDIIEQSFIDAYKRTAWMPPTAVYFSDTDRPFNRLYGALRKFATKYWYDDGEKSTWSDYSAVALPLFEPFTGINTIPTDNNGIRITIDTGDRTVVKVEIAMLSTSSDVTDPTVSGWVTIATIDKKKLGLSDNSQYTYSFYNDGNYPSVDVNDIIRPYSFMQKKPLCQTVAKNVMVYTGGKEGSPVVDIDVSVDVTYEDLFIDPGTENEFNDPDFTWDSHPSNDADYVFQGIVQDANGVNSYVDGLTLGGETRFKRIKLTVGADVKKGNKFVAFISNPQGDNYTLYYEALNTDSALTVANELKQQLIATGRIYRKTPDLPESNIYENDVDLGNVSFTFIFRASTNRGYVSVVTIVDPVEFNTLKDTGQSVRNIKLGSTIKLVIPYEDFDGRKSLGYTVDALVTNIKTINELGGIKSPVITLTIRHKPPIWAKYYQIDRSSDLKYGKYIQMLIQKVIDFNDDEAQDYLDLVVGSLYTYQRIHPNSPIQYSFEKGDRLSLIRNVEDMTYYPPFETEIIEYNESTDKLIESNIKVSGSATVEVAESSASNIGKFIRLDNSEREIVGAPTSTTYLLNNVIGDSDAPETFLSYRLIDRRGTIRIRKPNDITIEDNSTVEVYKPSSLSNPLGEKQFFEFQKKFPIINAGTENAYHSANQQNQTDVLPAIVRISEGTAYVRNREMPTTNSVPGTQLVIEMVEDESYSDFYPSLINDNGRVNAEDMGDGEIDFPNRMRFSKNFIEGTRINGLNMFDNLDREDFNDQYGDVRLTKFDMNRILTFKQLRTCFVPVDERLTQSNNGIGLNVGSAKFLNPIQYYAMEGGIGDNPESYASNGTQKYFLSPNQGVVIRLGGNGEEPISKTYFMDNEVRSLIRDAITNKAKVFGGFDRVTGVYIISIEGYQKYIYFDGFSSWILNDDILPNSITFEIVTAPTHGTATIVDGYKVEYNPTTGYIGDDTFSYRAFIDGAWSLPKNACIKIVDVPVQLAWRQKADSWFCVLNEEGLRTGYKGWSTLEQYNIYDEVANGTEKPNNPDDPDYVGTILDTETCSIEIGNEFRSQQFQRGCTPPAVGSFVTYKVEPNTFFADTLAAANALAEADIAENGQDYANDPDNGGTCLAPDVISVFVVDMYIDETLDVCAYIDTPGVSQNNQIVARNGQNFYESDDEAAEAFMLASDNQTGSVKRRFAFNIGKLIGLYPAINSFVFKIRGRSATAGVKDGVFALKNPGQQMIMQNSPGTYMPSVTPPGGPSPTGWSSYVQGGGNGSIGLGIGAVILTFTYDKTLNTLTCTEVVPLTDNHIVVNYAYAGTSGNYFGTANAAFNAAGIGTSISMRVTGSVSGYSKIVTMYLASGANSANVYEFPVAFDPSDVFTITEKTATPASDGTYNYIID